ncbi:hypothetical protein SDC9_158650 [bioreactor metagenome]|uniref:Uncharacterized protein n=1 Tax=bioreactor metagenome TaxID=1076179 RepID=A0A645FD94_9ZZZZ
MPLYERGQGFGQPLHDRDPQNVEGKETRHQDREDSGAGAYGKDHQGRCFEKGMGHRV